MENELTELCPICIEKPAEYFTECNHSFCIGCLCRIKSCAICRNALQRAKMCIQIKQKVNFNEDFIRGISYFNTLRLRTRGINVYPFADVTEDNQWQIRRGMLTYIHSPSRMPIWYESRL